MCLVLQKVVSDMHKSKGDNRDRIPGIKVEEGVVILNGMVSRISLPRRWHLSKGLNEERKWATQVSGGRHTRVGTVIANAGMQAYPAYLSKSKKVSMAKFREKEETSKGEVRKVKLARGCWLSSAIVWTLAVFYHEGDGASSKFWTKEWHHLTRMLKDHLGCCVQNKL